MRANYWVVSDRTEDRYGPTDTLEAAARLARDLLTRGLAGGPLSVEFDGRVVRRFIVEQGGGVTETTGSESQAEAIQR